MEFIDKLPGILGGLAALIGVIVVGGVITRRKGSGGIKATIGGQTIEIGEDSQRLVALQAEQVARHNEIEDKAHGDLDRDTRPYKIQFKILFQDLLKEPYLARAIAAEIRDELRDRVRDNNFLTKFRPENAGGYRDGLVRAVIGIYDEETELLGTRPDPSTIRAQVEELVTRWLYDVAGRCAQDCEDKIAMYEQFSHRFEAAGAPIQVQFCKKKIEKKTLDLAIFRARIWG